MIFRVKIDDVFKFCLPQRAHLIETISRRKGRIGLVSLRNKNGSEASIVPTLKGTWSKHVCKHLLYKQTLEKHFSSPPAAKGPRLITGFEFSVVLSAGASKELRCSEIAITL